MSTKIQWTEETWNPIGGCAKASPGCKNCYAMRQAHRMAGNPNEKISSRYFGLTVIHNGSPNWTGKTFIDDEVLLQPIRKRKPTTFFISLSDLFFPERPDEDIDRVFAVMALTPQHTYQILTKYPERMLSYWKNPADLRSRWFEVLHDARLFPGDPRRAVLGNPSRAGIAEGILKGWRSLQLPNVWLGVSVENQKYANERIPKLLKTPATVRFVSYEPALEAVDFERFIRCERCGYTANDAAFNLDHHLCGLPTPGRLDWVIVGGESGPGARPFNVEWARSTVRQCKAAGVACFVKQLGAMPYDPCEPERLDLPARGVVLFLADKKGGDMAEWPEELRVREMPEVRR